MTFVFQLYGRRLEIQRFYEWLFDQKNDKKNPKELQPFDEISYKFLNILKIQVHH